MTVMFTFMALLQSQLTVGKKVKDRIALAVPCAEGVDAEASRYVFFNQETFSALDPPRETFEIAGPGRGNTHRPMAYTLRLTQMKGPGVNELLKSSFCPQRTSTTIEVSTP